MKSIFSLIVGLIFTVPSTTSINEVVPYPDNSLYVEQYQQIGMPSPEEVWNAAEYKRAVKVIKSYYNVDKWSIPRKNSEYSGALFTRMTTIENFDVILDKSMPLQERLREHDELLHAINQFLNMYIEPNEPEQRFGTEGLILLAFSANTSKYSIEIINELQTMMSDRGMRNGDLDLMHDKLIAGVATSLEEYLDIIENDYLQYQSKDIETFTTEIKDWAISMKDYLSEEQTRTLTDELILIHQNHPNKTVKKTLKKLQSEITK